MRVSMSPDAMPVTACSWVSEYTVSLLPEDHDRVNQFAVTLSKVGPEQWIVSTQNQDRIWRDTDPAHVSYQVLPNASFWAAKYVRTLNEAFRLAWEVATVHTVNKVTAQQLLDKEGESNSDAVPDHPGAVVQEPGGEDPGGQSAGEDYAGRHRTRYGSNYQEYLSGLQPGGSCRGSD